MDYYNDIKFTTVGRMPSKFYHVNYRWDNYGIAFTRRGRMRFKKNNRQEKILEAPFVYWYSPENCYTHGCFDGESRDHSWCFCVGERIQKITYTIFDKLMPDGCLQITNPIEMCHLYDHMIKLYESKNSNIHFKLTIAFEQVVGQIVESYMTMEKAREPELYQKIRIIANSIKENPFKQWDFHCVANDKLFISYSYFRQTFNKIMNMPPTEYLLNCRMEVAAGMLAEEKFQIQEIAYRCGYDNAAAFTRSFKKRIGISPSNYIAHLQK